MCRGRRPIPVGPKTSMTISQEVRKVALGPSAADARRHTFASLRAPAARASIYLFILSRAAAHDAGSSGGAAPSQCCSSLNQHLFVAPRRHRRCLAAVEQHARRQLKTMCSLCQVRSLRMLIHAVTSSTLAWEQSSSGAPPLRHCG